MRQSETEATAERVLARFSNTRPRAQSPERQIDIARIADSYCAGLSRFSGRMVRFARVEFHSYAEWASVRDSVWDSVRDSVFEGEMEVLALGAVLYGIDKDGIVHLIMPTEDELNALALEKVAA